MTELMQESLYLIEGEQGRSGLGGFGEIHYDGDVRSLTNSIFVVFLLAETCHPSSALLGLAREKIRVDDADEATVVISDIEPFDIRMVDNDVLVFGEVQSVELCSQFREMASAGLIPGVKKASW